MGLVEQILQILQGIAAGEERYSSSISIVVGIQLENWQLGTRIGLE